MDQVYKEFDQAIETYNKHDPSFTQLYDKPDMKAWKTIAADNSGLVLKMEFTFNMDMQDVYRMLVENENRHFWDEKFHNYEVVETYSQGDALIYYAVKTPFMVTTRDMLTRRKII